MWVLLLRSFLLPVCVCPKKKKKRDSDVARELFCYVQSGQKELQLYSNQIIFPVYKLPHNFCGGGNNFIVAYKKRWYFSLIVQGCFFLFKYFILGLFIDCFYLICQVLLKIYFFFIPDLNTGFGTLTHISKSWQIFPSGEREKKYLFFCRNLTVILCACILRPPVRRSDFFFLMGFYWIYSGIYYTIWFWKR